jgi:hypothetical protein
MVASYLSDVETLLEDQHWDAALNQAFDLPRIAVALTDPKLQSSNERQRNWCEQWIRPADAEEDTHGLDYDFVRRTIVERMAKEQKEQSAVTPPVPARALRRLQLRRHVRTQPRGFSPVCARPPDPRNSEIALICTALVEAARRWYARSAVHDLIVQENLARLAVLR